mgnify:FL=1
MAFVKRKSGSNFLHKGWESIGIIAVEFGKIQRDKEIKRKGGSFYGSGYLFGLWMHL